MTAPDASSQKMSTIRKLAVFILRVVRHFIKNKGLLLAGAVGYNALISIIPLFFVILTILSNVLDIRRIGSIVRAELGFLLYDSGDTVQDTITAFANGSVYFGTIGFVVMIFFASIAFRMLEDAMAVIFQFHKTKENSRHPVVSMLIAFFFITAIGAAIFFLTLFSAILNTYTGVEYEILGRFLFSPTDSIHYFLRIGSFIGMVALLTSFYRIMPTITVRFKLALIAGFGGAVLWEVVRTFLEWYFTNLSLVNVIYGSLGTAILILVSFEVAAVIVLLGAQAIADLELNATAGIPWYEDPAELQSVDPVRSTSPNEDIQSFDTQRGRRRRIRATTRTVRAITELPPKDDPST